MVLSIVQEILGYIISKTFSVTPLCVLKTGVGMPMYNLLYVNRLIAQLWEEKMSFAIKRMVTESTESHPND